MKRREKWKGEGRSLRAEECKGIPHAERAMQRCTRDDMVAIARQVSQGGDICARRGRGRHETGRRRRGDKETADANELLGEGEGRERG